MSGVTFEISARSRTSKARRGLLRTTHGDIETPAFVVVATKATVKGLTPELLAESGVGLAIANTYHLHLEPGSVVVREAGGLHRFMGWNKPLMTDSGGFQVFSLGAAYGRTVSKVTREELEEDATTPTLYDPDVASQHGKLAVIDDEGVTFTSHIDGSLHRFTPERSIELQHELGADLFFAFDECTAAEASHAYQAEAMHRTHRWAARSLSAHRTNLNASWQGIFGIVQGGRFEDLRRESARTLARMDFDGYGIGGSYQKLDLDTAVGWVTDELPEEKPRHLLGIGEPEDIVRGIREGVDLFDCVQPTRLARTGVAYGPNGEKIQLAHASNARDFSPIDPVCTCGCCRQYTRAYLSHLMRAHEMLGAILLSMHNLHFLTSLVARERERIGD